MNKVWSILSILTLEVDLQTIKLIDARCGCEKEPGLLFLGILSICSSLRSTLMLPTYLPSNEGPLEPRMMPQVHVLLSILSTKHSPHFSMWT